MIALDALSPEPGLTKQQNRYTPIWTGSPHRAQSYRAEMGTSPVYSLARPL